jgi:hypothetical protein
MEQIILEKKQNTSIGRMARKEVKEIAKHYKAEFERMRKLRAEGVMGRIEFTGYY